MPWNRGAREEIVSSELHKSGRQRSHSLGGRAQLFQEIRKQGWGLPPDLSLSSVAFNLLSALPTG